MLYDNKTLLPAFATWGAVVKYELSSQNYIQLGFHEDNFNSSITNGWNWSIKNRDGWFTIAEYGHKETFSDNKSPTSFIVGAFHDSSKFNDPKSGREQKGSNGLYARAQNVLWTNSSSYTNNLPAEYIMGFSTFGYSPSKAQSYNYYAEVGANYHGLFKTRPNDYFGLKLAYLRINKNQLIFEKRKRQIVSNIDYTSSPNQFRIEFNNHIKLSENIFIEPSISYIINQNSQFMSTTVKSNKPENGFVLGLITRININ